MTDFWAGAEVISSYSRAQTIADGVLVDASMTGAEAGLSVPVALTAAAYAECVSWDHRYGAHQDEAGRLWDVVYMAMIAARRADSVVRLTYSLYRVPNVPEAETPEETTLAMVIGGGDNGEPVITIMLPTED